MAFREVAMFEIREVLRLWLAGEGLRTVARLVRADRKAVRRYIAAAQAAGVVRDGGEEQLTDELIGAVCEAARPARPHGHGAAGEALEGHETQIRVWVTAGLRLTKIADLLARRGVRVPYRTLHRFAVERCGFAQRSRVTVRVADGEPGAELQVDFGRMGLLFDPGRGRRRVVWALIFTACYSRHCFVWLSWRQTLGEVIAGCEAAWGFFGGVFRVLIPDNLRAIVAEADDIEARLNQAFVEYAQGRGFVIDPARVRHPKDKARVERAVSYVRARSLPGEDFADLADAQRRAERWCCEVAGTRIHGTTYQRPAEVFADEEQPLLLPPPALPYDVPVYAQPKVARDHHVEVAKALYSVPGHLIGRRIEARADAQLVKLFWRGALIKVHPRRAGGQHQHPHAATPPPPASRPSPPCGLRPTLTPAQPRGEEQHLDPANRHTDHQQRVTSWHSARWSHARGKQVVPSRWQATRTRPSLSDGPVRRDRHRLRGTLPGPAPCPR